MPLRGKAAQLRRNRGQGSGWGAVRTLHNWSEPKVIVRFWIIAIILGLVVLSALKLRSI